MLHRGQGKGCNLALGPHAPGQVLRGIMSSLPNHEGQYQRCSDVCQGMLALSGLQLKCPGNGQLDSVCMQIQLFSMKRWPFLEDTQHSCRCMPGLLMMHDWQASIKQAMP